MMIIAAAVLAWVAGALWYMLLSGPWVRVSGVQVDNTGQPASKSPLPYLVSGAAMVVISAAMSWIYDRAGVDTLLDGAVIGFAIGAFVVAPWTVVNNSYVHRPILLSIIDGSYAVIACTLIGAVLGAV
ncbi:MAG: DUF1761 domain-containing protein [Paracoccus sp. (in: a-proteobacteria)]|nr:DUF1761 domain-containing protein [Paracoccus sp. (in: a-proteobacteria)]